MPHKASIVRIGMACISLGAVTLLATGCATSNNLANHQPDWWDNAQQHGSEYLFFKALGESTVSMEDARQKAMRSVQQQVAAYVLAEVPVAGESGITRADVEGIIQLSEVQTMGHPHDAKVGSRWYVWLLGRYPVAEYEQIRRRVEAGRALATMRADALSHMNRQAYEQAEALFRKIIDEYAYALRPPFAVETIKLDLAHAYLKQNLNLRARQWVIDVKATATDPLIKKQANELFLKIPDVNLKEAFADKTVSVVCYRGDDSGYALNADLATLLNNRLSAEGVRVTGVRASLQENVTLIDSTAITAMSSTLHSEDIDVMIVVKLTVDGSKTGQKQQVYGVSKDVFDSRLNYWVVRVSDGSVLATDQTIGYSTKIDSMLHVMTTHRRHLPMYAAVIADSINGE